MASFLTKECPHCYEDSFGARELFSLNYFSADKCKACGKLVRNDGFRQFLTVPAILIALLLGLAVFASLPNPLEPFGLLLFLVLVALPVIILAQPVKLDPKSDLAPFTPDPDNDKVIVVKGWNEDELQRILDDFIEADTSGVASYKIEVEKRDEDLHSLTFPQDIHAAVFGFLVNYLAYPTNFALAGHSIIVAGKTMLGPDFQGIPESLAEKKAIIYVPENNQDYDVIYLLVETGATFANAFSEGVWREVRDARLSSEVKMLFG
jgi:uncharacterized protein (DUF983 family)